MTDLSKFRFSHLIEVRYADIDVLQHVNNAKYFTYMETARIHYLKQILGWDGLWASLGVIIAQAACEYKVPLVFGDTMRVCLRTSRLGTKSFDFEYLLIREHDGAISALGSSVQVAYDYDQQASIPIPGAWRERLLTYEPALGG
jgi:acyl-CoA thioester hydrolase